MDRECSTCKHGPTCDSCTYDVPCIGMYSAWKPLSEDVERKYDTGKVDMSLLEYFPNALKALCEVSMKGCQKYDRGSFTEVKNARRRYTAAMFRHYLDEGPGEEPKIDEELGLPHDFMVMWNAMVRVELRLLGHKLG